MPSLWMITSSLIAILIVSIMAGSGVLMAPISAYLILGLLAVTVVYFILLDFLKIRVFSLLCL